MRFSYTLYNLLVLNPKGLTNEEIYKLGEQHGLSIKEVNFFKRRMLTERIIVKEKKRKIIRWKLKEPKALAGNKRIARKQSALR